MIDLTTPDEVKLKLETVNNDFDAEIESMITDVSHRAQTEIDRDLELQTYTELHDGGCKHIYPREVPVISVTSITTSSTLDFTAGTLIPATDYALVNGGWDIAHVSRWPGGAYGNRLIYTSGYLDASDPTSLIPKDLRGAIAKQVAFEFRYRKFEGLSNADVADGALDLDDNMFLRSVMRVLNKFRKSKLG